ncbi:unnamed protein product [Periconia digitata]|uniref:Uncharacterized protein n=1 Tax=Periconia digitata TaxID=1303443 RepID=A0A9W4UA05_9PLEO|nr:unnamed protein product [Periconia digitata]
MRVVYAVCMCSSLVVYVCQYKWVRCMPVLPLYHGPDRGVHRRQWMEQTAPPLRISVYEALYVRTWPCNVLGMYVCVYVAMLFAFHTLASAAR